MDYKDFNATITLDANWPRGHEQIVFKTPDGTTYANVKVNFSHFANSKNKIILVELFTIKPKFKVGDIVTNASGLYPNVKCTITEVNEKLQYYSYKETDGITYFKDQDKLILVNDEEVPPPVEDDAMYLDIKEIKATTARFYACKLGNHTMQSIINKIKSASLSGKMEARIDFKDYPILINIKENIDFLDTWARLCGYSTVVCEDKLYITW